MAERPSIDAVRQQYRQRVREAMQTVRRLIEEHDDAPEGIELFTFYERPYRPGVREVRIDLPLEPWPPWAGAAVDREDASPDVLIQAEIEGVVEIEAPQGTVSVPWWAGWDAYERCAVIVCGP